MTKRDLRWDSFYHLFSKFIIFYAQQEPNDYLSIALYSINETNCAYTMNKLFINDKILVDINTRTSFILLSDAS